MPIPDTPDRERRGCNGTVEIRAAEDGSGTIKGIAAVVNQETVIGGGLFGFREKIAPGAFDDAVKNDDVRALFNHDPNMLLGRTASGTLRLSVTKSGLAYEVDLPDTRAAQDVRALIQRGDVNGSSFGFTVEDDDWDETDVKKGQLPLRTIRKVSLFDVSPVTYPAYPQTSVSARSKAQTISEADAAAKAASEVAKSPDVKAREAARARLEVVKAWRT